MSQHTSSSNGDAASLQDVLQAELDVIAKARAGTATPESGPAHEALRKQLLGLAFSGGGIRSATFNLGVIQALARFRLLRRFDYLSTVSGGGYIGSWLSAWIHRAAGAPAEAGELPATWEQKKQALENVEVVLAPEGEGSASRSEAAPGPVVGPAEPRQVSWLRSYSNYLTPRASLMSLDTLSGIATFVRNLLLVQTLLLLMAVVLVAGVRLLAQDLTDVDGQALYWFDRVANYLGIAFLSLALVGAAANNALVESRATTDAPAPEAKKSFWRRIVQGRSLDWLFVVMATVAAFCFARWLALNTLELTHWKTWGYIAAWLVLIVLLRMAFRSLMLRGNPDAAPRWSLRNDAGVALTLLAGMGVVVLAGAAAESVLEAGVVPSPAQARALGLVPLWSVVGVPVLLLAFGLGITVHVGTAKYLLLEDKREWWGRVGGAFAGIGGAWLVLFAAAVYGPWLLHQVREWLAAGGLAWIGTSLAGVLAGRAAATGGTKSRKWLDVIATVAPYVFMVGLLLAVAQLVHGLAGTLEPTAAAACIWEGAVAPTACPVLSGCGSGTSWLCVLGAYKTLHLDGHGNALMVIAAAALVLLLVLAWRIDVNLFSFHMFYRNRLMRCYLGASNEDRRPYTFTDFDMRDSPSVADLAQRPYHLVCTALNLTSSRQLAWQQRKAASFVFGAKYCGYGFQDPVQGGAEPRPQAADRSRRGYLAAFRKTGDYGALDRRGSLIDPRSFEISLARALTISGAAASPNMGYHSSLATAFLLTVFNVRLGWWMQNPAIPEAWASSGPRFGIKSILRELIGRAHERSTNVYLSDGGHFENLGIYELVRRRCRYVVSCDAGMDRDFEFEDLGNAIRKCLVDFGVRIDIDTSALRPDPASGLVRHHCAVGTIRYPADPALGAEAMTGMLLYVKPSLGGNEPTDVQHYARTHPGFPHQSTSDQWFDEPQFESYRKLGEHIMTTVLDGAEVQGDDDPGEMFRKLRQRWFPPSPADGSRFAHHGDQLRGITAKIRETPELAFLDRQLFPEWSKLPGQVPLRSMRDLWLPSTDAQLRAGFYLCMEVLQFMENLYVELDLEAHWDHPDNRGWMNEFRHWTWCGMFRVTFTICGAKYGARFQAFCRRRLGMTGGQIVCTSVRRAQWPGIDRSGPVASWIAALAESGRLNPAESDIAARALQAKGGTECTDLLLIQAWLPVDPDDAGPDAASGGLELGVGFALVMSDEDTAQPGQVAYLRIQDHLRKQGLAARAGRLLKQHGYGFATAAESISAFDPQDRDGAREWDTLVEALSSAPPGKLAPRAHMREVREGAP